MPNESLQRFMSETDLEWFLPLVEHVLPPKTPKGWIFQETPVSHWRNGELQVLCSGRTEADGKRWFHVSLSRPARMPDYLDMVLAKRLFVGESKAAIMVLPPKSEHVNHHPFCLHLWHCLDGSPLPDFRQDTNVGKMI